MAATSAYPCCAIVPPHVLDRLAELGHAPARRSVAIDTALRAQRLLAGPSAGAAPERLSRTVADAGHGESLPGRTVRAEGDGPVPDESANRAYDGLGATFALYREVYGRASIDDAWLPLDATVHYGDRYDNAFWNGSRMVFGDGDGEIFVDFTACLDVIGHELTHGVTQFTADLEYRDQPGALNESLSDVFGSLVKQYALGQRAEEADWLIGAGLLAPGVRGVALRSMKAPGTAYDDERLGTDPQPGHMDGYVRTRRDSGGVHINSGIPNRAFYLAAVAIGGHAWEGAGRIWYDTLTSGRLSPTTGFAAFARATVATAASHYPRVSGVADAVARAWSQVGISTT
ncbi:M4 family metallopeptidase [Kitasatospora sp. DSM 101779]|uniref:M4 family metallopeptidase n=1 Tax=Kitasatospora sp. DSM 101779 TaxID=2853165 RepID=UPI0021DA22E5|nr:M4 family metallopeptidase [Kitasatospora sp. DSM 101779]MCU7824887.1 M4 family metallopeptidase [Kitasatospora sp. DSM 101779]